MDEIIDIYDENTGINTNKTISKSKAHEKGIYHSSIHIIIINEEKTKVLLQKRCKDKNFFRNMWDISVGGHIHTKESPLTAASRELNEELGLNPSNYNLEFKKVIKEEFIDEKIISKEFVYVYFIISNISLSDIKIQKEEVSEVKWVNKKELNELIQNKKIINHIEEFKMINDLLK